MKSATEQNLRPQYRSDIDGLRGIAIIAVLGFHLFPALVPGGFIGVDVFFVVSGFLISSIAFNSLHAGRWSFSDFYASRIRRLFPALAIVLTTSLSVGWFVLLPAELVPLGKHTVAGATFVQNFQLLGEAGYFDVASELKPLMHLWSLSIEEQFYFVFPLLTWALWRRNLGVIGGLLAGASLAYCVYWTGKDSPHAFFSPFARAWELLAGAGLSYLQFSRYQPSVDVIQPNRTAGKDTGCWYPRRLNCFDMAEVLPVIGLVLILFVAFYLNKSMDFPGWPALLPVTGTVLVLRGGPNSWFNRVVLGNKTLVGVGLISYPLYLWHWPILSFVRIIEQDALSPSVASLVLILSLFLAWLTFHLIERPVRRANLTTSALVAALCLTVALPAGVGYAFLVGDGYPSRTTALLGADRQQATSPIEPSSTPECRSLVGSADIGYCRLSESANLRVALIGDSHAFSIYHGISMAYAMDGIGVVHLGGPGCVPFYNTNAYQQGRESNDCLRWQHLSLDFAIQSDSIDTIVLSTYVLRNMLGDALGNPDAPRKILQRRGTASTSSQSILFSLATQETVERLLLTGKRVIFVIDWPELNFDPRTCVDDRPFRFSVRTRFPCAISRFEHDKRGAEQRGLINALAARFPTLEFFDPDEILCDAQWCHAAMHGELLYKDSHHLSARGSELLGRRFHDQFPRLLGSGRLGPT